MNLKAAVTVILRNSETLQLIHIQSDEGGQSVEATGNNCDVVQQGKKDIGCSRIGTRVISP